jgi:hypothetical protein
MLFSHGWMLVSLILLQTQSTMYNRVFAYHVPVSSCMYPPPHTYNRILLQAQATMYNSLLQHSE